MYTSISHALDELIQMRLEGLEEIFQSIREHLTNRLLFSCFNIVPDHCKSIKSNMTLEIIHLLKNHCDSLSSFLINKFIIYFSIIILIFINKHREGKFVRDMVIS